MIKCEYFNTRKDRAILVKTYSTEKKYIKQVETGVEYDIAIDVAKLVNGNYIPQKFTYVETNKEIEEVEE